MRSNSDESYVIDLCDQVLGCKAIRNRGLPFLRGDTGRQLPVDAYYPELRLVVEFRERQHSEAVPHFDRRWTVSSVPRVEQRARYDQRRRDVLPQHGLTLIELDYSQFKCNERKRLRRMPEDINVVRRVLH